MKKRHSNSADSAVTHRRYSLFFNPWFQIALSTAFVAASELCLKRGVMESIPASASWSWTGLAGLTSGLVWLGILLVIFSFISWLYVLKHLPLSVAFPASQVVHVLIPITSWLVLGELISMTRWCGIAFVLLGLAVMAKPAARLEEKI
ncbi:MAG: EamA family transporter [Chthoniobacterales bacterium]